MTDPDLTPSNSPHTPQGDVERYFGSHAYNAGRHCSTASTHKGSCAMWRPPTSGHLHSWRRAFATKRSYK